MKSLILAIGLLFAATSFAGEVVHPKSIAELKKTSVRIINLEMTSGGTGSVLKSFDNATHILTNKHICRLIEPGGVVDYKGQQYLITHYKKFPDHDLCLVRVAENFGINLEVSSELAKESSTSVISGHPSLLPHIVTFGHLSEKTEIELIVGVKACTKKDIEENALICVFFGGMPIVKSFQAQLTSNLIKPGNSGSAVFNRDGEIIGVAFAGDGRDFSFGYIVPQTYVLYFLQNANLFEWVEVGTPVDDEGMSDRVFNFDVCRDAIFSTTISTKIKTICKSVKDNIIWSK